MHNVVINVCEKFHCDRLRNDRALGNRKYDNNKKPNNKNKNKTKFVDIGDPSENIQYRLNSSALR